MILARFPAKVQRFCKVFNKGRKSPGKSPILVYNRLPIIPGRGGKVKADAGAGKWERPQQMGNGPGAKGTTPNGRRERLRQTGTQGRRDRTQGARGQTKGAAGAKRPGRGDPVPALYFASSLLALGRPDGRRVAGKRCFLVSQLLSQVAFQLVHGNPHLSPAKIPIFAGPRIVSPGPEVNPGPGKGLTGDPWTP